MTMRAYGYSIFRANVFAATLKQCTEFTRIVMKLLGLEDALLRIRSALGQRSQIITHSGILSRS